VELLPLLLLTWALVYVAKAVGLPETAGGLLAGLTASITVHTALVLVIGRDLQFVILSAIFYSSGAMICGFFLSRELHGKAEEKLAEQQAAQSAATETNNITENKS
jgi:hypothetical protein